MANKLVIEIRHAAAAKAATDGNTRSVGKAPEPDADDVKAPPSPAKTKADQNKKPSEPKPPYAQEEMDHSWSKAEAAAMKKFMAMKGRA